MIPPSNFFVNLEGLKNIFNFPPKWVSQECVAAITQNCQSADELIEKSKDPIEIDECTLVISQKMKDNVLQTNEFSLHGLLGVFLTQVVDVLEDKVLIAFEHKFLDNRSYSLDGGVLLDNRDRTPIFTFELKQQVATALKDQDSKHIQEFFIQAFYMRIYPNVWHCLTDMEDFHYFKCCKDEDDYLKVERYVYIKTDIADRDSYKNHMLLLTQLYKETY